MNIFLNASKQTVKIPKHDTNMNKVESSTLKNFSLCFPKQNESKKIFIHNFISDTFAGWCGEHKYE